MIAVTSARWFSGFNTFAYHTDDRDSIPPAKPTGLSPKLKSIEPSGFQQNVRLVNLKLAPQEQNLGQPRF